MYKTFSVIITCLLALLAFACAGGPPQNSANTNMNGTITNLDTNNMPPGLSTSPLPINGNTPGIPDPSQVNINMKAGGTPTPGIPDPANARITPNPKGTPTPGIPSEAEIKKMMNSGNQTIRREAITPPAGNVAVQQRNSMKQMQQRKKPQE